ncbi:MAG: DUF262 domain-containing protein [Vicinamibacteria bacterium]
MRNIQKTVFKVSDFLSWKRSRSLNLSPAFQRRPVWPKGAKSFLIDTIVKGIPMPIIFLRERTDPKSLEPRREVVDGQQRLRTIISFIDPALLEDFDKTKDSFTVDRVHDKSMAGLLFSALPPLVRQTILDYDFSVQVLPADTEDREVLQIFARMNSTGFKLNDQELRNAAYFGALKQCLYSLATEQLDRWRKWKVFSETEIARMLEVEETSDIAITMLDGVHGKNQKRISAFYDRYDATCTWAPELSRRFQLVMDTIEHEFGASIAASPFRRRPLFHTLFTFFYDEQFGLKSEMKRTAAKPIRKGMVRALVSAGQQINDGSVPDDLASLLRGATGHLPARSARLQFLRAQLKRVKS